MGTIHCSFAKIMKHCPENDVSSKRTFSKRAKIEGQKMGS